MTRRTRRSALSAAGSPVAVLALAALCAGCGASSGGGSTAAGATTSAAAPSSSASPPATSTAAPKPAEGGNPLDAADFCIFLSEDAPKISAAGSPEGALAQLSGDLAFWIEARPEQKPRTAADLDAAAAAACPDVAKTVLTALGAESFMDAFN